MTEDVFTDDLTIVIDQSFIPERIRLFEEKCDCAINDYNCNVIVDLAGLVYLDSLVLAMLIRLRSRLSLFGRTLRLVNCN